MCYLLITLKVFGEKNEKVSNLTHDGSIECSNVTFLNLNA
jgi:hypothetical protein